MTHVLITSSNLNELETKSITILTYMIKWFAVNGLSLNKEQTNVLHFKPKHLQNDSFQILYKVKEIKEIFWPGA